MHVHPGHVVLQPHPVLAGSHGDESAARPERPGLRAQVQEEREERGRMLLRRRLRHHHLHHAAGSALPRPASPADLQVSGCVIIPVCSWICLRAKELCESRGGPSWAPLPNKPTVSEDVKQHSTNNNRICLNWYSTLSPPLDMP